MMGKYTYIDSSTYAKDSKESLKAGFSFEYNFAPVQLGKYSGILRCAFNREGKLNSFGWFRYSKVTDSNIVTTPALAKIPGSIQKMVVDPYSSANADSLAAFISTIHGKWTYSYHDHDTIVSYEWKLHNASGDETYSIDDYVGDIMLFSGMDR